MDIIRILDTNPSKVHKAIFACLLRTKVPIVNANIAFTLYMDFELVIDFGYLITYNTADKTAIKSVKKDD